MVQELFTQLVALERLARGPVHLFPTAPISLSALGRTRPLRSPTPVSAPGHDKPKRARAYMLTDQAVTETAARYANSRPGWTPTTRAG